MQDCTKGYILKQCKNCEYWQDNEDGVGCTKSIAEDECIDFSKAWIAERPAKEVMMFKNRTGKPEFEIRKF